MSEQRAQPFLLLKLPALVARLTAFRTLERGRLPFVTTHPTPPEEQGGVTSVDLVRANPVFGWVILNSEQAKVCDFFWRDDSGASGFTVVE